MSTDDNKSTQSVTTLIIKQDTGNALGIAAFVFGVLSIFFLAPVFVPLALLLGIIAVIKKQLVWNTRAGLCLDWLLYLSHTTCNIRLGNLR